MAQFKVPQDVQRADTIVGPLTMVQLIIAIAGGGLAYVIYITLQSPVNIIMSVIIAGITAAFALIRVHDMPFMNYLAALTLYLLKPRLRVWEKGSSDIPLDERVVMEKIEVQKPIKKSGDDPPQKQFKDLHELTSVLDTAGTGTDDLEDDDNLVRQAFGVDDAKQPPK
ncbi:PrgI family protein [Candidatus Gracilibacteria bacterium]|nr:PrgI family protein [Candidatus Gracilibacteria bacterium]